MDCMDCMDGSHGRNCRSGNLAKNANRDQKHHSLIFVASVYGLFGLHGGIAWEELPEWHFIQQRK